MTVMAERTHTHDHLSVVTVEEFEAVARDAAADPDAPRLEFIGGRIQEKRMPDGDHNVIVMWLLRVCMQHRPELVLFPSDQGLKVEKYRKGRAKPDGSLAPWEHFLGKGEWADPDGVLMTVEVTSYDSDTEKRDRLEKPLAYAAAGIPVHLLIDREPGTVTVFSEPDPVGDEGYRVQRTVKFGESIFLPSPVGFELDTEPLKDYVR